MKPAVLLGNNRPEPLEVEAASWLAEELFEHSA